MNHNVFVYGTLKNGQSNNHLLESATFIGQGMTIKPYYMANLGGFPVVTHSPPKHNVAGELFECDDET
ncbi:MAG TPA: gamma-glutamylcyclotransferase family protein, partial [Candidatus Paceibacterota bacterium]